MKAELRVFRRIRQHCLGCCGGSRKEVRLCPITDCELWHFRFGSKPKAAARRLGSKGKDLFEEANFQEGAMFGPGKSASEIEA